MTNHDFNGNDILSIVGGAATAFFSEIVVFGGEILKAAVLGIIGGAAAYVGKHLVEKYIKPKSNAGRKGR